MKKIILSSIISIFFLNSLSFALTLDEINKPFGLMGRMGNSNNPVKRKIKDETKKAVSEEFKKAQLKDEVTSNTKTEEVKASASYADLSLKKLAQDVSYELELDEAKTTYDLSVLWNAATERSETMKYTIYKLSNPDEDKPNDSMIKKILKPIANISSIAGVSVAGDPFMATGALIGGGLVNAFMKDDKEEN